MKITFKDVIGMNKVKDLLRERLVEYYGFKDEMLINGYEPSRGMLLYGIPGTGKTMIATAAINELLIGNKNIYHHIVDAKDILCSQVGESSKKIKQMFDTFRLQSKKHKKDIVLVMDEIDVITPSRNTRSVLAIERTSAFLRELGGIDDDGCVYIIGTTNRPWDIDPALLRNGRFEEVIHVKPPDIDTRKGLLEQYITSKVKIDERIDMEKLIEWTEGYVGADFSQIGKRLFILSKKKEKAGKDITIDAVDIISVFKGRRTNLDANLMKIAKFESAYTKFTQGQSADFEDIDDDDTSASMKEYYLKDLIKVATHCVN